MTRLVLALPFAVLTACATAPQSPLLPLPASQFQSIADANMRAAQAYFEAAHRYWDSVIADALVHAPNFAAIEQQAALTRSLASFSAPGAAPVRDAAFDSEPTSGSESEAAVQAEIAALELERPRLFAARALVLENLANLDVRGYRRRVASTSADASPTIDVHPGELFATDRPLDLAIDGAGFFVGKDANGELRFTRNGAFQCVADGSMAFADGTPLEPRITVPEDALDISIDASGRISVARANSPVTSVQIGCVTLVRFREPQHLQPVSATFFVATAESGEPMPRDPYWDGCGQLRQRYLETSNVHRITELGALPEVDNRLTEVHGRLGWLRPPSARSISAIPQK